MPKQNDFNSNIDILDSYVIENKFPPLNLKDNVLKDTDIESLQRNSNAYSCYLETFVNEYKKKSCHQRVMKIWFFVLTLFLLFALIGGGISSIIIVSLKRCITLADVATVITAVTGAVSSFLILPKIIAENLFPSKEEDRTAEIFGKMFEHDISIRSIYNDTNKEKVTENDNEYE